MMNDRTPKPHSSISTTSRWRKVDTGPTLDEELSNTSHDVTSPTHEAHAEYGNDQEDAQGAGRPKRTMRRP
ncbi:unnamed protein product [Cuscuta campestris]|uniref:Uncharacterized protein n=1 Tax=Cuscuta campestris TaxID=132261 RepID=A0A484L2F0_9ASTE|nr:unnamed protein product [Cuscuta campestris]